MTDQQSPAATPTAQDGRYYAKGERVWKAPVKTPIAGGSSISLGFPVCTMHEAAAGQAETVAALMNAGDVALAALKAAPPLPIAFGAMSAAEQMQFALNYADWWKDHCQAAIAKATQP